MNPALYNLDPRDEYTNLELEKHGKLKNNWRDSSQVMMARWIALVLKLTNQDIHKQYMN